MIAWILSVLAVTASAVPLSSDVLSPEPPPPPPPQGVATQCQVDVANQILQGSTAAPLAPAVSQPQPLLPQPLLPQQQEQQQNPQPGAPQFMPFLQHYGWPPLGGNPLLVPLQPSGPGTQAANQPAPPQQPLAFSPYGYFPLLTHPYTNQLISPYGFPMIPQTALPQTPANQPPNTQVLGGETPPGPAPSAAAPQPTQQQQKPQIVYMIQQPMTPSLGSVSSEELQMAAQMGQLGVYLLANPPAGAAERGSQAAGLANALPAAATSPPGVQQSRGFHQEPGPGPDGI